MTVKVRLGRSSTGVGAYVPLYGKNLLKKHMWEEEQKAESGDPYKMDVDWDELRKELTHRHSGHPRTHDVRLGHRPKSTDPLHGEEGKLAQQYVDLKEKALAGQCNPQEMQQMRTLKGRISEINASRVKDARAIYMGEPEEEQVEHEGDRPLADMRSGFHSKGQGIRRQTPVYDGPMSEQGSEEKVPGGDSSGREDSEKVDRSVPWR